MTLKIASFNLRYDTAKDGPNAWAHRREWVRDLLERYAPDIVGAQEALESQVQFLTAGRFDYVGVGRDDGKEAGEYAPIFYDRSRFTVRERHTFWLSPTPEMPSPGWDATLHRICTWAKFTDTGTGRDFTVFNTHWDHRGEIARLESARLMLQRIPKIAGDEPYILTGDFNLTPVAVPIRLLATRVRNARDASETLPTGPTGTFNGFNAGEEASGPIDYIFVHPGIRVLSFTTIAEAYEGRFPSDHHPILATVTLP